MNYDNDLGFHQVINPTNFGCPTTEGSDLYQQYMGMDPVYCLQREAHNVPPPQHDFYGDDVGYHSPQRRHSPYGKAMNSRNGLYSPMELPFGRKRNEYCTSLPGIGEYPQREYSRSVSRRR